MTNYRKQSFMQSVITIMLSQIVIKILGLAYKLYLTNKEGFGDAGNAIYTAGFQVYALIITMCCIGIPNAISKMISEKLSIGDYRGAKKIFKVAFAMLSISGFLGATFLFLFANTIANKLLELPEAELSLIILAPSIFFEAMIAVFKGYFNGHQNMRPMAKSQTVEQCMKTILTVVIVELIYFTFSKNAITENMASGANLATTIATFISFLLLLKIYIKESKEDRIFYKNHKQKYFKSTRIKDIIKNILIIAMPMTLSAMLGSLNRNVDSLTVVRALKTFLTDTEAQIQYGMLSGKIETMVTFPLSFNIAFATTLIPAISAAKAAGNIETIKKRVSFSLLINILIGIPCCVGMILFAEPVLKLLFPNASNGALILRISSVSIIFLTIGQTINGTLQGLGKSFVPAISLGIGVITKIIINLIFVKINPENFILGGIAGAAFGTVMCHIVSTMISFIQLRKNVKIKLTLDRYVIKPIFATIVMILSAILTYKTFVSINFSLCMILTILVAIITYLISLFVIRVFTEEEILMLPFGKKIIKYLKY